MQEFGYPVLEAMDGEDAVKTFQEHADKVQRVLCDLMMLKKNGKETLEEIRKKPGHEGTGSLVYSSKA